MDCWGEVGIELGEWYNTSLRGEVSLHCAVKRCVD